MRGVWQLIRNILLYDYDDVLPYEIAKVGPYSK